MASFDGRCQDGRVNDVTRLLQEMAGGDARAGDKLIALVYGELRRMAAHQMGSQANQTLQPTALVHEAWLRLGGEHLRGGQNRAHFFATAATAMRSILIDRARRRKAQRHGGGRERVSLNDIDLAGGNTSDDQILAVHEVLEKLAADYPQHAELVKLRYFAGLSVKEAADVLGVSEPTVHRWWAFARAWLGHEIKL
jgi:RNA polymerase sigma factor (TIGR02999 family)